MVPELRDSGISLVGEVPWGTHFCYFYETKQDLLDILVPYFKAGLEANEFCLWIVSNSELITSKEAKEALGLALPNLDQCLSEGRMEIISHDYWWFLKSRTVDYQQIAHQFKEKLDQALAAGYVGMRLNGSPAWMRPSNHEAVRQFEKEMDRLFPDLRIIAACTYPVEESPADILFDLADSHRFTIARRRGKWDVLETPELLQAKQQIERLNSELEQRVVERTKELEEITERLRTENEERKNREAELRQSQRLLQLVLATLPVGVAVTNQAGDIVLTNAASKRIWGGTIVSGDQRWAHSKAYWHDSGEMITPAEWASARALSEGQISLNELIDIETYNGKRKIMENSAAPIRNEDGLIVGAVIVNQDVTDRVRAEEALRRSEYNLRLVIDTIPIMAWTTRPDGVVDFLNQRWLDYAGLSLEEYVANPTGPIHPDDTQRVLEKWEAQKELGEIYDDEMRLRRADGEYRWFLVRTAPLRDDGNIVKWYGVSIDIEDRKKAEEKLKETSQRLRALSASRQTAREEESKRIAREIHDELGGALTSWRWDLEEIRDEISESLGSSEVASVRTKIDAMIELTEATLDRVRRLSSELRPMALELGLVAALEWQALQFRERTAIQVDLICSMEKADLDNGAATAVFRILQEALTNIQRHAQATKVLIAARQESGDFILTVKDNGRGITEIEKTAPQALGLLGMRERAHLVGGEIYIENAEDEGTEITVRIPLTDREPTADH